jgi:Tfp pilus assembly protein FimV
LSGGASSFLRAQIAMLKAQTSGKPSGAEKIVVGPTGTPAPGAQVAAADPSANVIGAQDSTLDALKKLQQQMTEMNARLAKIESQLATPKAPTGK